MWNGRRKLLSRYNLEARDLDAIVMRAEGRCEACGKTEERMHLDHNHATGLVRGILCNGCNLIAGVIENESFDHVSLYLQRTGAGQDLTRDAGVLKRAADAMIEALIGGPRLGAEVVAVVREKTGASHRTVYHARAAVGVVASLDGKRSYWRLPTPPAR